MSDITLVRQQTGPIPPADADAARRKPLVPAERIRELFDYDPLTGVFTRRIDHYCTRAGDVAGCRMPDGRICIRVDGNLYLASRLAWVHYYGVWPTGLIDHKSGVTNQNWISNLRDVPNVVNQQNIRKAMKSSKTKLLGASPHGPSFRAEIRVHGVKRNLGTFPTAEEAHAVYVEAKRRLHEGCTI